VGGALAGSQNQNAPTAPAGSYQPPLDPGIPSFVGERLDLAKAHASDAGLDVEVVGGGRSASSRRTTGTSVRRSLLRAHVMSTRCDSSSIVSTRVRSARLDAGSFHAGSEVGGVWYPVALESPSDLAHTYARREIRELLARSGPDGSAPFEPASDALAGLMLPNGREAPLSFAVWE
jgi:hypothetical protein